MQKLASLHGKDFVEEYYFVDFIGSDSRVNNSDLILADGGLSLLVSGLELTKVILLSKKHDGASIVVSFSKEAMLMEFPFGKDCSKETIFYTRYVPAGRVKVHLNGKAVEPLVRMVFKKEVKANKYV